MAFDFDIPDELIRELGSMLVESSSSIPVAYLEHEDFKIGIRGSIIYVINPFGICQSTTYWRLPEGQAFFLYVCINRWLWHRMMCCPATWEARCRHTEMYKNGERGKHEKNGMERISIYTKKVASRSAARNNKTNQRDAKTNRLRNYGQWKVSAYCGVGLDGIGQPKA